MTTNFFKVAVDAPLKDLLTYASPEGISPLPGQPVKVPLGKRTAHGVVLKRDPNPPDITIKSFIPIEEETHILPQPYIDWGLWMASYYMYPPGQVFSSFFPPLKKTSRSKALTEIENTLATDQPAKKIPLNEDQRKVVDEILSYSGHSTHLLFGVTGSGKTEVYLELLNDVIKSGRQGLVLVPEISLTPQLLSRFSQRFPNEVAVIHSQLTEREKTNQWWQMVEGKKKILIGARSALFCPIPKLGLIVVDEEHEPSYKQEEKLKYHGRDAAIVLGHHSNCPVILGSATPSLESWNNVKTGKFKVHHLSARATQSSMPEVVVVDLREVRESRKEGSSEENSENPFWLSEALREEIQAALNRGEQSALFLNRRGVAQMSHCPDCGHVSECPNCSVSLTVHHKRDLVCHYCGYTEPTKTLCGVCHTGQIEPLGLGTELIENDLRKLFPKARIARADRDEIQNRSELENLISGMEKGEIDILVGTQMIAKGLDFPKLTCVGLVLADVGFHWPDFRATERSFQLLTQVAGRSGRHSKSPGKVIIQTYNPEHISVKVAQTHDNSLFYQNELSEREDLRYPPFSRLTLLKISGTDQNSTQKSAELLARRAKSLRDKFQSFADVVVLGPAPAPLAKLRGKYRHQLLLKSSSANILREFCLRLIADGKWLQAGTKVQADVDPLHML